MLPNLTNWEKMNWKINVQNLRGLWHRNKRPNILPAIRVREAEEKEAGVEQIFQGLHAPEVKQTPKRIKPRKMTPKLIILNLLRSKDKKKIFLKVGEKQHLAHKRNDLNDSMFFIRNHRGQKKVSQQFSSVKRKESSVQNPVSSENIL